MEVSRERYEELRGFLSEEELKAFEVINTITVKELPHKTAGRITMQKTDWDTTTDIGEEEYIFEVKETSTNSFYYLLPLMFKTRKGVIDFCKKVMDHY